jgi:hypothetical protein
LPPGSDVAASNLRRTFVGIIGVGLLLVAGILVLVPGGDEARLWMSSCLRVGSVMCLLWLAWPQLSRLHPWLVLGALAALVAVLVFARQPRILIMGLVILIVLARLRPRPQVRR